VRQHLVGEYMNAPPASTPTAAGATPPDAMAGTSSDQHDAATITPAANPIIPSIRRRGADRKKNTGRVPMAVNR
jgi:hypothetical protein